ncbi:MAG: rRNA maturation RNase YbeY [Fimbriimonadaceae bacterium]|nr:rRNA maturation RNase YbeY [Fimbriimonadaceae bacterium]
MEPPSRYRIQITNSSGKRAILKPLRHGVQEALRAHKAPAGELSILICDNAHIQALNKTYRQVDEPTDVLTFPPTETPGESGLLGDIAISREYAEQQASLRGVSLAVEIAYLGIHGALHLVGFDDENERDRQAMMREMHRIGLLAGLPPEEEWTSVLHQEPTVAGGSR